MRVLRGRAADVAADRDATRRLIDRVGATDEPAVRVWRPPRQAAFGRRDARADGYRRARRAAAARGYPPVERETGGRAVAHTGATVAVVRVEPVEHERRGVAGRYRRAVEALRRAVADVGVDARPGEPNDAFCPGSHGLRADGKLAGLAQRVGGGVATVGGVLVVADRDALVDALAPVYGALGLPLDPEAVGSVERAGGDADVGRAIRAVERAFVGDADPTVEHLGRGEPPTPGGDG